MWFEFQAKGQHNPLFEDTLGIKGLVTVKDGERLILKIVDTIPDNIIGGFWYDVEDDNGNKATIHSKDFYKITNPKNYSKKFNQFKVRKGIKDN